MITFVAALGIEVLSRAFAKVPAVTQVFVDLVPSLLGVLTRSPLTQNKELSAAEQLNENDVSAELQVPCRFPPHQYLILGGR